MRYTVITGASSGIGYESALAFAERGKNLILIARREHKLEDLKAEIRQHNAEIDVVVEPTDLSIMENVYAIYEKLKVYEIDTWINNAGFGVKSPVADQDLDKVENMILLNTQALTILSTLYVRDYTNVEGSQLINVASSGGYSILPNAVTYTATKFFVSSFTEGLAEELASKGASLQAKILAPGITETEFAKRALDTDKFDYKERMPNFHTAKEMAQFMLQLYDSDKTLGLVDEKTYEFELKDPVFTNLKYIR
ncbi:SDR family NAD(P)-dependent oxidoreductase [Pontibacillus yanchengensis]|uniref:SDR family NAD(P)-dependent oxidoreductase n=1 Tax=Pontibacillus yanchengensis TaxID=462910 RepID=A0ACC7VJV6_9BACI|nr:SDR family NAD(P)-dependent oxidoreductase [Pontibacillus yanchengensis]MYL54980.1 SDR family NAD(P)-dependent oxidoreductase [Pontibacillus yanchengensis]